MTKIGNKELKSFSSPYIIAEIGVNHEGSIDKAKELIFLAKKGGADAAKFQTYKAETIASINSPYYWDIKKESTKSQYALFKKYDVFNQEDYVELSDYCKQVGIDFASTPFDEQAVDFLDPIMKYFKVASADITNIPLLRKIASKNKIVILSTGASNKQEIDRAIEVLNKSGITKDKIILLHCILNYPTNNDNANLLMIQDLIETYEDHQIGYSDHTIPDEQMRPSVGSYLLGATVIEKHFTNNKELPGNDHYHAMDVDDLKNLILNINKYSDLMGEKSKKPLATEEISRLNARRSIIVKRAKKTGDILQECDLICKRPGTGVPASEWDNIIGKKIKKNLNDDHILLWSDFE